MYHEETDSKSGKHFGLHTVRPESKLNFLALENLLGIKIYPEQVNKQVTPPFLYPGKSER